MAATDDKKTVDIWDVFAVKHTLDDEIVAFMEQEKKKESHLWTDVKLVLGTIACLMSASMYLYKEEYPNNRWLIMVCGGGYWVLSVVLQFIATYIEGNTIMETTADKQGNVYRIMTGISRPEHKYAVEVKITNKSGKVQWAEEDHSFAEWFTESGVFHRPSFISFFKRVLANAKSKKTS
eukprot:TRINITY_DN1245_c0_g3_i1.p1 TRINITY_DN1245_c0_g3~~TRINITY_DN1245_c0_g3_i1.p1  ORF type:complete len:179 (-),score=70.33 TRINITY_DN1245_c0_g3_i1:273-809(-)